CARGGREYYFDYW
nr:immunoglobulin heavy chain junction region [Mus musculus]MBK4195215.1 immunoglobulin heavy chain junction region [Mus musculus]